MLNIISGCPRSGTSLMTLCFVEAFGETRFKGKKFPQLSHRENLLKYMKNETEEEYRYRQYVWKKQNPNEDEEIVEMIDMNPKGFWEGDYTVNGIYFNTHREEDLNSIKKEREPSYCKIVSQGLVSSDPQYIRKIIYMVRHPREVAKSQERLRRPQLESMRVVDDQGNVVGKPMDLTEEIVIHTPEVFMELTLQSMEWMLENSHIPVHFVQYEDLVERPKETLLKVKEFLDCGGDFEKSIKLIEPKLRRSSPEDIKNDLWSESEYIYEKLNTKDPEEWKTCIKYMKDPERNINKQKRTWYCFGSGMDVNESICKECIKGGNYIQNGINISQQNGIDWKKEPCSYECGQDMNKKDHKTVEESIKNNFWNKK